MTTTAAAPAQEAAAALRRYLACSEFRPSAQLSHAVLVLEAAAIGAAQLHSCHPMAPAIERLAGTASELRNLLRTAEDQQLAPNSQSASAASSAHDRIAAAPTKPLQSMDFFELALDAALTAQFAGEKCDALMATKPGAIRDLGRWMRSDDFHAFDYAVLAAATDWWQDCADRCWKLFRRHNNTQELAA